MANPWFRLYSEFADDPKVQSMPEVMQRRLIMLFCLRCKDETFDVTLQAFHWRITPEEMQATKKLFLFHGFIDEDWELLNWNRRQFLSDSSTERTRKYRQRLKQGETSQNVTNPEDFDKDGTGRNVTVTAPDTDTDADTESETEHTQKPSARKDARKFALTTRQMLEDLSDESLGDLALEIACRHPRSRLRGWTPRNVGQADTVAILDAMQDEAQRTGVNMAEAGRMMLGLLDAWDDVPRERWQYVAAIPKFYKQGDYRLEPKELPGIDPQEGKTHGKRNGVRGTDGNVQALQEFLAEGVGGNEGVTAFPQGSNRHLDDASCDGARPEDEPGVAQGLRSVSGGLGTSGDHAGIQPSTGRAKVLPTPSYPSRIQWPRRNG